MGNTLLMLAAGAGVTELVEAALHHVRDNEDGKVERKMSITMGDDASLSTVRNVWGETALHAAAAGQTLECCKVLIERTNLQLTGPASKTSDGRTPLDMCVDPFRATLTEIGNSTLPQLIAAAVAPCRRPRPSDERCPLRVCVVSAHCARCSVCRFTVAPRKS